MVELSVYMKPLPQIISLPVMPSYLMVFQLMNIIKITKKLTPVNTEMGKSLPDFDPISLEMYWTLNFQISIAQSSVFMMKSSYVI